jgi:NADH dehydrogenase [ubiquinone] 1 alpha subcomplex assembly factor 6
MEDAVYDVATAAYDQLLTARSLLSQIPEAAFPALLSAVSLFISKNDQHIINF